MFKNLLKRLCLLLAFYLPGGYSIRPWLHRLRGVKIGKHVWISKLVYIDELHPENVSIGDNCTISLRSSIFAHLYWGSRKKNNDSYVSIEKNTFIGPHCIILPNVIIGEGSVIKGGTVVAHDIKPLTFIGQSSPKALGKVTVTLTSDHSYEEFIRGLRPIRKKKEKH